MAVTATSTPSSVKLVLVICIVLGLHTCCCQLLPQYWKRVIPHPKFQFVCKNLYIRNTIETMSCEVDLSVFAEKCRNDTERDLEFYANWYDSTNICSVSNMQNVSQCKIAAGDPGTYNCEEVGNKVRYNCFFNASEEYEGRHPSCRASCYKVGNNPTWKYLYTNGTCEPMKLGTLPPPTAAPPPPAPAKSFPIWLAVLIATGIAGVIGVVVFIVWRKRRQAPSPVQDPEGGGQKPPESKQDEEEEGEKEEDEDEEGEEAEEGEEPDEAEESEQPEEEEGGEEEAEEGE